LEIDFDSIRVNVKESFNRFALK